MLYGYRHEVQNLPDEEQSAAHRLKRRLKNRQKPFDPSELVEVSRRRRWQHCLTGHYATAIGKNIACTCVITRLARTIPTTFTTTAAFTASATPRGPPLASMPLSEDTIPTIAANTTALPIANQTSSILANAPNDALKLPSVTSLTVVAMMNDAITAEARMTAISTGARIIRATNRGTTKYRTGSTPITRNASSSSRIARAPRSDAIADAAAPPINKPAVSGAPWRTTPTPLAAPTIDAAPT